MLLINFLEPLVLSLLLVLNNVVLPIVELKSKLLCQVQLRLFIQVKTLERLFLLLILRIMADRQRLKKVKEHLLVH